MKLLGYVEVFNHLHNVTVSRSRHSTLSIFRDKDEPLMLIQQPSNKSGQRYKINGNILKVFRQFVSNGKATIRMKEPPHELRIQNEPIQLVSFLRYLTNCCGSMVSSLPAVPANPKFTKGPPTAVVINSLKDYGMVDRLSLSTERLQISNIKISKLSPSVARLKKLNFLEVSDTSLSTIPVFIKTLPNLMELVLPNNHLCSMDLRLLIDSPSMRTSLRLLDLRHNKIMYLPDEIYSLRELVTLKLDHNELKTVPFTISRLKNLRILSLSNNKIISYPYTLQGLKGIALDVSNNTHANPPPLNNETDWCQQIKSHKELILLHNTKMHSLKELALRAVLNYRLEFAMSDLPVALQNCMNKSKSCFVCLKGCFNEYFVFFQCVSVRSCGMDMLTSQCRMMVHHCVCSYECMLLASSKFDPQVKTVVRYVNYTQYVKSEK